jgi:hypothetical protein
VQGTRQVEAVVPGDATLLGLAACRGRVYATFERRSPRRTAFGRFRANAWELEEVGHDGPAYVLGFDEACRRFVAVSSEVLARGNKGWVKSETRAGGPIRRLLGFGGSLHAVYEEVRNGVRIGVKSAPLVPEP